MTRKPMKTYGSLYQLPNTWPIYPEDARGHRQRLVIVATTSRAKAVQAFAEIGFYITVSYLANWGYADMGGQAAEVATAEPGRVFYAPADHRDKYVPVDPEWSLT